MLHFGRMNTDTAAACFLSVDDKVVCVCADTCKHVAVAAVDFVHILHVYAGERVVHRVKTIVFVAPFKQREFGNPQNVVFVFVVKPEFVRDMRAKRAQTVVNDLVFIVRNDKDKVAFSACKISSIFLISSSVRNL